ncbi:MAG: hypothetical protein IJ058_10400 [Lachnospiraceae bacterium]|nr:hypothetical protein [Lachnospiraceae bacterium]
MAMGINFNYTNFVSSYGMQQIPRVDTAASAPEEPKAASPSAQDAAVPAVGTGITEAPRAPKTANLEDISLTFNKQDDFGTIGRDADIARLDMDKVVSDSKRESILSGYRTFVGPTPEQMVAEYEDGLVRLK